VPQGCLAITKIFMMGFFVAQNIFSTILNLASLQIRNSLSLRQPNLLPFRFDKNCFRKNLHSHSEPHLQLFLKSFMESFG